MKNTMKEKILIACFSQKGKESDSVSAKVAKAIGAELEREKIAYSEYVIEPTEIYPEDRENLEMVVKLEKEQRHRPELTHKCGQMQDVEKIILVSPNWFNDLPMGVYTFFDSYDFSGKVIVPMIVHGGDGAAEIVKSMRDFLHKCDIKPAVEITSDHVDEKKLQSIIGLLSD